MEEEARCFYCIAKGGKSSRLFLFAGNKEAGGLAVRGEFVGVTGAVVQTIKPGQGAARPLRSAEAAPLPGFLGAEPWAEDGREHEACRKTGQSDAMRADRPVLVAAAGNQLSGVISESSMTQAYPAAIQLITQLVDLLQQF